MDPYMLAGGLEITKKVNKGGPASPPQTALELEEIKDGANPSYVHSPAWPQTPAEAKTQPASVVDTPTTPEELEANQPARQNMSTLVPSFSYPALNKYRVAVMCLAFFGNGLQDGATGALIPYMEQTYNIGYALVSLIFITNAAGFIIAAFGTDVVATKLGRARTLMLSEVLMAIGYIIIIPTPPFPAVIAAYFFIGLGYALDLALNNVFGANLAKSTVILGISHGCYAIGGLTGPLIGTAMASNGIIWSRFYCVSLAVRVVVFFASGFANRGYESEPTTKFHSRLAQAAHDQGGEPAKLQLLRKVMKCKITLLSCLFLFAYQGAEVAISGWVISFLIAFRGGDPSEVGYVTSGFWGGIGLGRFTLTHLAPRVGEKRFVYCLTAGSVALQLLVWLVPNIIGNAVAVSLLGFLLGPVAPCSQFVFARLLPQRQQVASISFIASAGSSGGAIAPLVTGLLAQAAGTYVLHPICIALFAVMCVCWYMLPAMNKRDE